MITSKAALAHTRKALEYVEDLSNRKTTLYTSTQAQIKDMIRNCYNLIEIGQSMLDNPCRISRGNESTTPIQQEDSPFVSHEQFRQLFDIVAINANCIRGCAEAIEEIRSIISETCGDVSLSKSKHDDSKNNDEDVPKGKSAKSSSKPPVRKEPSVQSHIEVHEVECAIDSVVSSTEYADVIEYTTLSKVISDWFKYRIKLLDKKTSPFRYHSKNLIEYIRAIVIDYCCASDTQEWFQKFSDWMKRLIANDPRVSSYALPYDIFQRYKINKEYTSSQCMVGLSNTLWTMFSECGLSSCLGSDMAPGPIKFNGQTGTCRDAINYHHSCMEVA